MTSTGKAWMAKNGRATKMFVNKDFGIKSSNRNTTWTSPSVIRCPEIYSVTRDKVRELTLDYSAGLM
jgi:hypothetical protein